MRRPFNCTWMGAKAAGICIVILLFLLLQGQAVPHMRYSHAGLCPNDMNPNLWVDAQSTCQRECEADQVSTISLIYVLCP